MVRLMETQFRWNCQPGACNREGPNPCTLIPIGSEWQGKIILVTIKEAEPRSKEITFTTTTGTDGCTYAYETLRDALRGLDAPVVTIFIKVEELL